MRKITAFYAWQSDTPERFNRHLIQIALRDAAKRITDSMPDVELILAYDTAGVPGTPPISDTILKRLLAAIFSLPTCRHGASSPPHSTRIPGNPENVGSNSSFLFGMRSGDERDITKPSL
jgi:hypothetical protein